MHCNIFLKKIIVTVAKTIANIAQICYYLICNNMRTREEVCLKLKICAITTDNLYYQYGKTDSTPENLNTKHCHDKYEILYIADGTGKCMVEGVEYPIKPRTLMIFPPLSYHCAQIDSNITYERYVIYFDKKAVLKCAEPSFAIIEELSEITGAFYSPEVISDAIVSVLERFISISSYPETEREICAALYISELMVLLSRQRSDFYLRDDCELGARVIRYLNQNMDRDITLDMLAQRFFVSKYYLCRAFKKHNGISIHGYINRKRVMYAKQLIEAGETASGAAYRVGFGDYSAFYRAYVKLMGRAPTQQEEKIDNGI